MQYIIKVKHECIYEPYTFYDPETQPKEFIRFIINVLFTDSVSFNNDELIKIMNSCGYVRATMVNGIYEKQPGMNYKFIDNIYIADIKKKLSMLVSIAFMRNEENRCFSYFNITIVHISFGVKLRHASSFPRFCYNEKYGNFITYIDDGVHKKWY